MTVRILHGDCRDVLKTLPERSVQMCCTSPPYFGLRSYGIGTENGEIGLEPSPDAYVAEMVAVFRAVRRVLRPDGVLFLNLGDSFLNKQLQMIPARVALALQDDGWILRSDIIWHKPNPMPESDQGSHYSRHMVTIADYERLSGLPYADERAGDDWAGDMPSLSEAEISGGQAPLSAEREGTGHSPREGRAAGREREAQIVRGVGSRSGEQSELRSHAQRQGNQTDIEQAISRDRVRQAQGSGVPSGDEGHTRTDRAKAAGQRGVCQNREDDCEEAAGLREAQGRDRSRRTVHGRDVVGCGEAASEQMLLLQAEASIDDRSRDRRQQGGQAHRGEHRSSVPKLQLKEGQQASPDLLVGCPGCERCARHHGYIFHLSAGRPTSAHEHVFLLAKSARYFWDADAVREEFSDERNGASGARVGIPESYARAAGRIGGLDRGLTLARVSEGRNTRNVWTIVTQPYADAHFATFPPELAERCIKAGSRPGDTILDPFAGAFTTPLAADRLQRNAIGIELNADYCAMARKRLVKDAGMFMEIADAPRPVPPAIGDLFDFSTPDPRCEPRPDWTPPEWLRLPGVDPPANARSAIGSPSTDSEHPPGAPSMRPPYARGSAK